MIQLIGLNSKSTIDTREKFAVLEHDVERIFHELLSFCSEVVLLCTCNRTEIYFNAEVTDMEAIEVVFQALNWDIKLINNIFYLKDNEAAKHLMEVACGFHSKILGEDQILGQIKKSYYDAFKYKAVSKELHKLFQLAITCGKEFKFKTKLYRVPVSASSIAVRECINKGARKVLLIGYGNVGKLTAKYIISSEIEKLYIAVRDINSVEVHSDKVEVVNFNERKSYYAFVDCIISCTSSQQPVIYKEDITDKEYTIFDLSMPRGVERSLYSIENVQVFDIDKLSLMDDINKENRRKIMWENKEIIEKHLNCFSQWHKISKLVPDIKKIKAASEEISNSRYKTYKNKKYTKDNEELVERLIRSTSNAYVNRAIEVLKEEQLKGRAEECLRIIERIFYI